MSSTSTLTDSPAVSERFDAICRAVGRRQRGFTLTTLADAHALARELEAPEQDRERIEQLAASLGLGVEELADGR